ncbi:MAG: hypothetical protein ACRDG3_08355 [Tepidiformaceae bacterium]
MTTMPDFAIAPRPLEGHAARQVSVSRPPDASVAAELHRVRLEAQARYSEVDLLVVTLRDHIRDLRLERDALRAQLARTHEATYLASTKWLPRGMKPPR